MMKLRFYLALLVSKLTQNTMRLLGRNGTVFAGEIARIICPSFLAYIDKPDFVIAVTGTNGKTTVCNMLNDALHSLGYETLNNKLGSNIHNGVVSAFILGTSFFNKTKHKYAVLEVDELSSKHVYPYLKPTYIICTNLFRDSIKRNAHTDYIVNRINAYIPEETTLILNSNDLISSNLGNSNKKIYYGISKIKTLLSTDDNITKDITICPNCLTNLVYDYRFYHHLGSAKCPNCDFKSKKADYLLTSYKDNEFTVKHKKEKLTFKTEVNNTFNLFNKLAAVSALTELGFNNKDINKAFKNIKIVDTRFRKEKYKKYEIIKQLAKGQNPIACSQAFEYAKNDKGNKIVFLILDDNHEKTSSENITWLYDSDYQFFADDSIKQVLIGGVRARDHHLRLLIGGVDPAKMIYEKIETDLVKHAQLNKIDKIFILHDLYSLQEADDVIKLVKERIRNQK